MPNAELLTALGAVFAIFFSSAGSSFGSIHSGTFAVRSTWGWKAFIPIIISGVLAIYGIIIAVILCGKLQVSDEGTLTESDGYRNLTAGLTVGLACLSSGIGMGHFMKAQLTPCATTSGAAAPTSANGREGQTEPLLLDTRHNAVSNESLEGKNDPIVATVLVLVYLEAIGLYGLIVALILSGGKSIAQSEN